MGDVVAFKLPDPQPERAKPMPARLDAHDAELLLRWAMHNKFTAQQLRYAVETVRLWAQTRNKPPLKRDWVQTIQGAMRAGWALRGFKQEQARLSNVVNPRTGLVIVPATPIDEAYIARYLANLEGA